MIKEKANLPVNVGFFVDLVEGINDRVFGWVSADIFVGSWKRHCGREMGVLERALCSTSHETGGVVTSLALCVIVKS